MLMDSLLSVESEPHLEGHFEGMVQHSLQCNRNAGYHSSLLNSLSKNQESWLLDRSSSWPGSLCRNTDANTDWGAGLGAMGQRVGKWATDISRCLCSCRTQEILKYQLDLAQLCLLEALIRSKSVGRGSKCLRKSKIRWNSSCPADYGKRTVFPWVCQGYCHF